MNNYLLYGEEEYLINKYLKDIIEENNISSENIIRYNLDMVDVSEALVEASTVSMFNENKLIILEGCKFLTGENKKEINHDIDSLIKYLNNPFNDVYLIFIVNNDKLDERKKIVKEIKKLCKIYECKKVENYNLNNILLDYIKEKKYNISNKDISLIIEKVGTDLSYLISEIDKLLLYKDDDKNITREDINDVIVRSLENNVFALTNSIMNNDKNKIFDIYNDLIKVGEDPTKLLIILSNQFRLILQVKLMQNNGYTDNEMISVIKEHPYRIKLAKETNYSKSKLIKYIKDLSDLDYKIKSGIIDRFLGFELFLLNI